MPNAAIVQPIAGPFDIVHNSVDIGITEDGSELEHLNFAEPVRGDNLGDSIQDEVIRGGDVFMSMVLQEYNIAMVKLAFWPWDAVLGVVGQVGRLKTDIASPLVLTAVAGTPTAGIVAEDVWTFPRAIIAANFPLRLLFAARHRKVPLRFQCLPEYDTPNTRFEWYSTA